LLDIRFNTIKGFVRPVSFNGMADHLLRSGKASKQTELIFVKLIHNELNSVVAVRYHFYSNLWRRTTAPVWSGHGTVGSLRGGKATVHYSAPFVRYMMPFGD
jgi:hypothetical protein